MSYRAVVFSFILLYLHNKCIELRTVSSEASSPTSSQAKPSSHSCRLVLFAKG